MAVDATTQAAIDAINQAAENNAALTTANVVYQGKQAANNATNNAVKGTAKTAENVAT
ncbi:MAG: hypothetical protein ACTHL1_10280 [Burkholderiaceae bacterium]